MPATKFDKDSIKESILGKLQRYNGRSISDASEQQIYKAVASTVRDQIMQKFTVAREERKNHKSKRLYYLSVEFLMGRSMFCNMLNLVSTQEYREALSELGISLDDILKEEPEPGLGNGGLGRLAACFLDSLASLNLPAMGCTIRYEYGLFRQKIVDGQQVELPDSWLDNGNVWEMPVMEDACEVHYGGHVDAVNEDGVTKYVHRDYYTVEAVPYDMPIVGYNTENVNVLRTWSARSKKRIDLSSFGQGKYAQASEEIELAEVISKVLYPEDNHYEGKMLRLKQHYFFTSATLQYIIKDFKKLHGNHFELFPDKVCIHINDTHPGLAIPELMRILIDEEGLGWDEAAAIVEKSIAYTNHTIMAEALEKWPEAMVKQQLPRIYMILEEMNRRLCARLWEAFPGQWERIGKMAIISYDQVHMANLCVAMTHSVNGVSQLHGDILKEETFHDYNLIMPEKFSAITNGITHRRWLIAANPELADFLDEKLTSAWQKRPELLSHLAELQDDPDVLQRLADIKLTRKKILARKVREKTGLRLDPDTLFDIQVKRIHSYKRQLMNVLHIMYQYDRLRRGKDADMVPTTYFFGGKAAPGYYIAKETIRLICVVADVVNNDPATNKMLKVVFIENFGVSIGEVVYPAADVSEQISTASKEASGTGNMKFMMNGAITLGTMDGANVEIHEAVGGDEHCVIFGLTAEKVMDYYANGKYSAWEEYNNNESVRRVLDRLVDGTYGDFRSLFDYLLQNNDEFFILKDFDAYRKAHEEIMRRYRDREKWNRSMLLNIAASGRFSSDRTIEEYANDIWHLKPVTVQ